MRTLRPRLRCRQRTAIRPQEPPPRHVTSSVDPSGRGRATAGSPDDETTVSQPPRLAAAEQPNASTALGCGVDGRLQAFRRRVLDDLATHVDRRRARDAFLGAGFLRIVDPAVELLGLDARVESRSGRGISSQDEVGVLRTVAALLRLVQVQVVVRLDVVGDAACIEGAQGEVGGTVRVAVRAPAQLVEERERPEGDLDGAGLDLLLEELTTGGLERAATGALEVLVQLDRDGVRRCASPPAAAAS